MEFPCVYRDHTFIDKKAAYVCEFTKQNIPEDVQIIPNGLHAVERKNDDVVGVIFRECGLTKVPQGLTKIFPNLRVLSIWSSTLKNVNKMDLAEYKNIEKLGFCDNKIEYLPGDLLEGFMNLEEVGFNGNELELIEPNILDGLAKLKFVSFVDNPAYNQRFAEAPYSGSNATLEDIKEELIDHFDKCHKIFGCMQRNINGIRMDIKRFLQDDETYKDLRININDREFLVHKLLVAARSPTIAEILRNNPEIENLNLADIPVETFEKVLQFLYTDEIQLDEGTIYSDLFAAAGKLKIDMLKDYAAKKLIETIETENALYMLELSNKYEHYGLKLAAFAKIKVEHPNIEFKDKWASDVDTLHKIFKAYKLKVAAVMKIEEDFKNFVRNC